MEMSLQIPLDRDGFRRHECPTCEREFKWAMDAALGEIAGGPFCPYCGVQAPEDSWWTGPQLAHIEYLAMTQVVQPEFKRLSSRHLKVRLDRIQEPASLAEDDSMRRVVPTCHSDLPVKVVDDWVRVVYCSTCGQPADVYAG